MTNLQKYASFLLNCHLKVDIFHVLTGQSGDQWSILHTVYGNNL